MCNTKRASLTARTTGVIRASSMIRFLCSESMRFLTTQEAFASSSFPRFFFSKEKAYLIPIAPLAFAPHRRTRSSESPSPQVVLRGLTDFTPTHAVQFTSPGLKPDSISSTPDSLLPDLVFATSIFEIANSKFQKALLFANFTRDTSSRLRAL